MNRLFSGRIAGEIFYKVTFFEKNYFTKSHFLREILRKFVFARKLRNYVFGGKFFYGVTFLRESFTKFYFWQEITGYVIFLSFDE